MRIKTFFLWISPLILASIFLSLLTVRALGARTDRAFWNDAVADRIRLLVGREFVDEIDEERGRELFFAAMEGYLRGLDPYCTFYDPEEREAMEEDTTGHFGGIGVQIDPTDEGPGLLITGIREDDPADRAGMELGDRIVNVAGADLADLEEEAILKMIRGVPGSEVTIGVLRGEERYSLLVERAEIEVDSVVGVRIADEEHGIGYLRIVSFQENTGTDAGEALARLKEMGARSFVLDLRLNTGGVLEKGAVALVDLFLAEGVIVKTSGRTSGSRRAYEASRDGTVAPDQPLVVLVDRGSASAAEVVAGAFQDHRRGILLGERTFGKFLVQSIHRLPDLDVALQLTTARYYTPYGRWLQRRDDLDIRGGLLPDILVSRDREATQMLLRKFRRQHGLHLRVSEEAEDLPDPQLERAVEILASHATAGAEAEK